MRQTLKRWPITATAALVLVFGMGTACDREDVRDVKEGVREVEEDAEEFGEEVEEQIDKMDTDGKDD